MKKNVDWTYLPSIPLTMEEVNKKLKYLNEQGVSEIKPDRGLTITSIEKCYNHYFWAYEQLHVCYDGIYKYRIVQKEEDKEETPFDYFEEMKKTFYSIHKTSFNWHFGSIPKNFYELRCCVPSQLSWFSNKYGGQELKGCYKADVSSAFSAEACKMLPTWREHVVKPGIVQPTAAYPFAFVSTGRLIIYNELDTDDFYLTPFYYDKGKLDKRNREVKKNFGYPTLDIQKEIGYETKEKVYTVLMKASKYTLNATMNYYYNQKKDGDKTAKNVMNYFIGMCWRKKQPSHLHLAAVVIARCNKRMIDTAYELLRRNNTPILIATDSIAWIGKNEPDLTTTKKYLGAFVIEVINGEMIIKSSKCYQVKYQEKVGTYWSGVPKDLSSQLKFGEIKNALDYDYEFIDGKFYRLTLENNVIINKEEL